MTHETSSKTSRLFIAISIPEDIKTGIERAQAELRRGLPGGGIRWTRREQFHLTLKFLGDVDDRRLTALADSLKRACRDFPALHLCAERIGFFPNRGVPRVIWVGVQDHSGQLPLLQSATVSAGEGFTAEKSEDKFTGHVTLGRAKDIHRSQAEQLAALVSGMADRLFGEWTADKVEIIRSELSSDGSRYTSLAAISLLDKSGSGPLPLCDRL